MIHSPSKLPHEPSSVAEQPPPGPSDQLPPESPLAPPPGLPPGLVQLPNQPDQLPPQLPFELDQPPLESPLVLGRPLPRSPIELNRVFGQFSVEVHQSLSQQVFISNQLPPKLRLGLNQLPPQQSMELPFRLNQLPMELDRFLSGQPLMSNQRPLELPLVLGRLPPNQLPPEPPDQIPPQPPFVSCQLPTPNQLPVTPVPPVPISVPHLVPKSGPVPGSSPGTDGALLDQLCGKVAFNLQGLWHIIPKDPGRKGEIYLSKAQRQGIYDQRARIWCFWRAGIKVLDWFLSLPNVLQFASRSPFLYRFAKKGTLPREYGAGPSWANDIVVVVPKGGAAFEPLCWGTVRAIGELRPSIGTLKADVDSTVLQLAECACHVFSAQPNRRWIRAFTLCGSQLRVWRFDRAGACGSTLVDIDAQPSFFLRTMMFYLEMGATDAGFDPTIRWSPRCDGAEEVFDPTVYRTTSHPPLPFVYLQTTGVQGITDEGGGNRYVAFSLCPTPVYKCVPTIVAPGTVHWPARLRDAPHPPSSQWPFVVKDQWCSSDDTQPEAVGHSYKAIPETVLCHPYGGRPNTYCLELEDIHSIRAEFPALRLQSESAVKIVAGLDPVCARTITSESKYLFYTRPTLKNRIHSRLIVGPLPPSPPTN